MTNKTKSFLALGLLSVCCYSLATEVYITRDAQGNIVFSDQPQSGAETHKLKELPTVPAFKPPVSKPPEAQAPQANAVSYTSLGILTPSDQYQLPSGLGGELQVSGILTPKLEEGHVIELLDNGKVVDEGKQTLFTLRHLDRGEHKLQLRVVDQQQKTVISSNKVTIYVQRYSRLNRSGK